MERREKDSEGLAYQYADEQSAARGLLGEVASTLAESNVDFVVIGGWIPLLFNNCPIPHPGTYDVDVLLNEAMSIERFERAAQNLLQCGYMRAPKNKFQLHRILLVAGESFVYHVDFLHRRYADEGDDLIRNWGRFQSIAGPGTDLIFTENERRVETIHAVLPSGEPADVAVCFCTEVGLLATKGRSVKNVRRTRDAFDVFLVIRQSGDYAQLVSRCKELLNHGVFRISLENLRSGFEDGLIRQATNHLAEQQPHVKDPEAIVRTTMRQFFIDVGLVGHDAVAS